MVSDTVNHKWYRDPSETESGSWIITSQRFSIGLLLLVFHSTLVCNVVLQNPDVCSFACIVSALRLYCHFEQGTEAEISDFTADSWNLADVLLILSDIVVAIAEYSLDVDPTHNTFEDGLTWLFVYKYCNVKLIRLCV